MKASFDVTTPHHKIFLRSKQGLDSFLGPNHQVIDNELPVSVTVSRDESFDSLGRTLVNMILSPVFSADGKLMAVIRPSSQPILVVDTETSEVLGEIPCLEAQDVHWSPLSTHLITWSRPIKSSADNPSEGNLQVWSVTSFALVASYHQRQLRKGIIQWNGDEQFCIRMVTNELHIMNGHDLSLGILGKIHHKGIAQFKLSVNEATIGPITICTFTPEVAGNPARCALYPIRSFTDIPDAPISTRTVFSATEASIFWNKQGTSVLIHTKSDVDRSGVSYYGATGLFLMTADGEIAAPVAQSKEGPIHDVAWSPLGDVFVVAAGHMPGNITLYSSRGEAVYEFGAAPRNTICWSPHGRFLCLAGFGNLAGDMDFWEITPKRRRKIGSNSSHCAVSFGWSPCSRYFMTATLTPRMNVDNGFKIFSCEGAGPLFELKRDALYDAQWRPAPATLFPDRGPHKKPAAVDGAVTGTVSGKTATSAAAAKPAPYRPPGSSGTLAGLIRKEKESGGAQQGKVSSGGGGGGSGSSAGKSATNNTAYKPPARAIPGMPPPPAQPPAKPAAAGGGSKGKQGSGQGQGQGGAQKQPQPSSNIAPPVPVAAPFAVAAPQVHVPPPPPAAISEEERAKRVKLVKKKLKLVQELKQKVAEGLAPNADQLSKLSSEVTLQQELKELEGK